MDAPPPPLAPPLWPLELLDEPPDEPPLEPEEPDEPPEEPPEELGDDDEEDDDCCWSAQPPISNAEIELTATQWIAMVSNRLDGWCVSGRDGDPDAGSPVC